MSCNSLSVLLRSFFVHFIVEWALFVKHTLSVERASNIFFRFAFSLCLFFCASLLACFVCIIWVHFKCILCDDDDRGASNARMARHMTGASSAECDFVLHSCKRSIFITPVIERMAHNTCARCIYDCISAIPLPQRTYKYVCKSDWTNGCRALSFHFSFLMTQCDASLCMQHM